VTFELKKPVVRLAEEKDVDQVQQLLDVYAREQIILARTRDDILENLKRFIVAEADGKIKGCAAIRDFGNDLLEVRSLAVQPDCFGQGIGRALIEELIRMLEEERHFFRLFALTYKTDFFVKLGFQRVSMDMFPEKIWSDCVNCPKKEHCDEEAVLLERKIA
jgi:amino-acid N-acetyltransferase